MSLLVLATFAFVDLIQVEPIRPSESLWMSFAWFVSEGQFDKRRFNLKLNLMSQTCFNLACDMMFA